MIPQKTVEYRPTDKLVFVTLGILAGSETVSDLNQTLRPNKPLLLAFGYDKCADQSVISTTLNAATAENVCQLQGALDIIWSKHNLTASTIKQANKHNRCVTIDLDLTGQLTSKKARGAKKGYFAKQRNKYGRQLARVLVPETGEIVTESLYPGNVLSCEVFKEMISQMEKRLNLETQSARQSIRLRLDAGFGTDSNINYALWLTTIYWQRWSPAIVSKC